MAPLLIDPAVTNLFLIIFWDSSPFPSSRFTASITGEKDGHSVTSDEAHEMLINKDLTSAVTRPVSQEIQLLVNFVMVT